jgi:hypothetical protein
MKTTKTTKPMFPVTFNQLAFKAATEAGKFQKLANSIKDDLKVAEAKRFHAAGGCSKCGGRGWIVVWDTSDSLSGCYAEYGPCNELGCTEETRAASGLDASTWSKYDNNRCVKLPTLEGHSELVAPLEARAQELRIKAASARHSAEIALDERRDVVVVKGRKAPIGFIGRIFWSRAGEFGVKVGVRNAGGEVAWTYLSNLEVIAA